MVVLIGTVVGLPTVNGVLATGVAAGALSGTALGVLNAAITKGPIGTTVAAASAMGGVASAMLGSVAATKVGAIGTRVVTEAALASITGAGTGAGVSSAICAAANLAPGILTGPVGWTVLGTAEEPSPGVYTFDCWKQVLHDDSTEPSNGRLLRDVIMDPRIKQVRTTANSNDADLPHLILENIWDEHFFVDYIYLEPNHQLVAHAVQV